MSAISLYHSVFLCCDINIYLYVSILKQGENSSDYATVFITHVYSFMCFTSCHVLSVLPLVTNEWQTFQNYTFVCNKNQSIHSLSEKEYKSICLFANENKKLTFSQCPSKQYTLEWMNYSVISMPEQCYHNLHINTYLENSRIICNCISVF